jgi:dihydroorotate dehydrogenase (fumarate)
MADLSTQYLGLDLKNPLVPSASPLSKQLESAQRLEDAGAAALVMHSMFEEKIEEEDARLARFFHQQSLGHGEAESFHPVPANYTSYEESYLQHLETLRQSLEIPIIASLNGCTPGGWTSYARSLQDAGANALELNVYYIPADQGEDSSAVEKRYLDILRAVRQQVSLPITMKLSPQFSAPLSFARELEAAGADGLVLFNRFYQPDINLDTLLVEPRLELSSASESLLRIRWLAIMHGRVNCSLAITGGVHEYDDVLKSLLAGADVTHMCSALLRRGPEHLATVLYSLNKWLDDREYTSVTQLKGSMSQQKSDNPSSYLRTNYMSVLDSYHPPKGVRW